MTNDTEHRADAAHTILEDLYRELGAWASQLPGTFAQARAFARDGHVTSAARVLRIGSGLMYRPAHAARIQRAADALEDLG